MNYDFEWDPAKAATNLRKHGVGFDEAATVFLDPNALSRFDDGHSEDEDRWVTLGVSSGARLIVVCHVFREVDNDTATVRIISSRKATKAETEQFGRQT